MDLPPVKVHWDEIKSLPYPTVAAGTQFAFTIPVKSRARLDVFGWRLVTSATVAARSCHLGIFSGAVELTRLPAAADFATQAASLSNTYEFAIGMAISDAADQGARTYPLPDRFGLAADLTIKIVVANMQAGDQLSINWVLKVVPT